MGNEADRDSRYGSYPGRSALTEREYAMLLASIESNATSLSSTNSLLQNLRVDLAERYLQREDDDRRDEQLRRDLEDRITNGEDWLKDQIGWMKWIIALEATALLGIFADLVRMQVK